MNSLQSEINTAIQYHQSGDLDRAAVCYRKILKRHPDDYNALHMLGVLNYQKGKYKKSIELLEKARKKNICAEVLINLGNVLTATGKLHKAKDTFIHAVKLKPELALSHFNLGNTYRQLEDYDNAVFSYGRAIEINKNYYDAIHNIAIVYKAAGKLREAKKYGLHAVSLNPNNAEAQYNLAGVLMRLHDHEAAIKAYKKTLKLDPKNMTAKHLLSALTGQTTEKPPNEYIAELFDDFASTFDEHLVNKLKYRTPEIIFQSVSSWVKQGNDYKILDLGCGTGLCGKLLIEHANYLAGVDLSSRMIDKAKILNVYHDLSVEDIQTYLDSSSEVFDIIVSADVFVYIGDLEPTFRRSKNRISKDGIFVFSVEEYSGEGYKLLDTGRYAHSTAYIREIAAVAGFREIKHDALVIREQDGQPIKGCIFIFENT